MTNIRILLVLCAAALGWCARACWGGPNAAHAQVSRPATTATPQPDPARGLGVPQPATAPSCVAGDATLYSDSSGNIYACAGASRKLVVAAGVAPAFPTATVTATPTATATATPTPTVTATP